VRAGLAHHQKSKDVFLAHRGASLNDRCRVRRARDGRRRLSGRIKNCQVAGRAYPQ
jgi:hypothetical protein